MLLIYLWIYDNAKLHLQNNDNDKWFMSAQMRHYVYKQALSVFFLYENSAVYGKKGHHWSRVSNGWLHFVDLFRLSDSDIEKTTICTALTQPWWSRLGTLFTRPWTAPCRSDALWKRGLDTHMFQRNTYQPPCGYTERTNQMSPKTYVRIIKKSKLFVSFL